MYDQIFVEDPLPILFDFSAAFPSAVHTQMRESIPGISSALGARRYLLRWCKPWAVTIRLLAVTSVILRCGTGVAKGCPTSAWSF